MSPEQAFGKLDELVGALRALCAERRTGTLFVSTADNQTARFVLRQGEIIAVQFRVRRGLDAITHLQQVKSGRFNFTTDMTGNADVPALPSTEKVLATLAQDKTAAGRAAPAAPAAGGAAPAASRIDLERLQRVLEASLTEYLGPMARVICREQLVQAGDLGSSADLTRLVEAIAKEIGDPAKEAQFKREALAKLRE